MFLFEMHFLKMHINESVLDKLEEKYTKVNKNFACHFCMKTTEQTFAFDCGHLPFCETCSNSILKQKVSKCSVCNNIVTDRQRIFLDSLKFTKSSNSEESQNVTIID